LGAIAAPEFGAGQFGAGQLGAGLKVAYHAACSLQHGQRVREAPKDLLRAAGFEVVEVPEAHLCCGSAGTYNLLQPEFANELRARKLANIARTGAAIVSAGNIGCLQQLEGRPCATHRAHGRTARLGERWPDAGGAGADLGGYRLDALEVQCDLAAARGIDWRNASHSAVEVGLTTCGRPSLPRGIQDRCRGTSSSVPAPMASKKRLTKQRKEAQRAMSQICGSVKPAARSASMSAA
jgi:hypothetical protein